MLIKSSLSRGVLVRRYTGFYFRSRDVTLMHFAYSGEGEVGAGV